MYGIVQNRMGKYFDTFVFNGCGENAMKINTQIDDLYQEETNNMKDIYTICTIAS